MTARIHRNTRDFDKPVPYGQKPSYTSGMWFVHCPQHGYIGTGHAAWHHNPVTAQAAADRHNRAEHTVPREWVGFPEQDAHGVLPPDLMWFADYELCDQRDPSQTYLCSRPPGHTGRHAASDGDYIVAVWECSAP